MKLCGKIKLTQILSNNTVVIIVKDFSNPDIKTLVGVNFLTTISLDEVSRKRNLAVTSSRITLYYNLFIRFVLGLVHLQVYSTNIIINVGSTDYTKL